MSDRAGVLNLGSGRRKIDGAVNLDISDKVGADLVHDLTVMPWPLPSDTFREVHAQDVVEHLNDTVAVMEEIHRVCRGGARVCITVPHFSSANAYTDPTHRRLFSYFSFDYFDADHAFGFYSAARFKRTRAQIVFYPSIVNKLVHRVANRWPLAYERRWAWIFPAWFLSVELDVIK
jgi:SAM-dependent methyltransferase